MQSEKEGKSVFHMGTSNSAASRGRPWPAGLHLLDPTEMNLCFSDSQSCLRGCQTQSHPWQGRLVIYKICKLQARSLLNLVFRPYWSIVQVKLIVIVSVKDAFKTSGHVYCSHSIGSFSRWIRMSVVGLNQMYYVAGPESQ
ncbi:unnamed protein product [Somion occarium]|uniref:Uncharacterized protein n=1 Tax=Somion occarium TaxID=3059160 RepID=A0ABP1D8H5_9APHY